ncbi:hypothetical protein DL96DRAFT_1687865 [Flagelloscypha sp. PMI_526]|nr:hypothetical protein DL96DRAFT_1687865 [Flagelloscypha sp. PMI_526]
MAFNCDIFVAHEGAHFESLRLRAEPLLYKVELKALKELLDIALKILLAAGVGTTVVPRAVGCQDFGWGMGRIAATLQWSAHQRGIRTKYVERWVSTRAKARAGSGDSVQLLDHSSLDYIVYRRMSDIAENKRETKRNGKRRVYCLIGIGYLRASEAYPTAGNFLTALTVLDDPEASFKYKIGFLLGRRITNDSPDTIQVTKLGLLMQKGTIEKRREWVATEAVGYVLREGNTSIKEGLRAFKGKRKPRWNNPGKYLVGSTHCRHGNTA